jgi:hypothetical protein
MMKFVVRAQCQQGSDTHTVREENLKMEMIPFFVIILLHDHIDVDGKKLINTTHYCFESQNTCFIYCIYC